MVWVLILRRDEGEGERKIRWAIGMARGPVSLTMLIPPSPRGVEIAAIVSIVVIVESTVGIEPIFGGDNNTSHWAFTTAVGSYLVIIL